MSQVESPQLKFIEMRAFWRRTLLIVPIMLAAMCAWYTLRWAVGNTIATTPELASNIERARAAVRLAPNDPQTHFTLGVRSREMLLPEDLPLALREYEWAVSLSPHDFRLWMDMGRAREQAGDAAGGERALRRAAELAPFYADPRWFLGNLLLREGRLDESFQELRRAGDADPSLRPQIFNLASRMYNGNVSEIMARAGDSAQARAQLIQHLINLQRVDDALRLWASLNPDERGKQREAGEALMSTLFAAKRFRSVLDVYRDVTPTNVDVGRVSNNSFEQDIDGQGTDLFGWQVVSVLQAQIHLDAKNSYHGERSLRIIFDAPSAVDFRNISQFIVVEPSTRYRLQFFIRTVDLKTASTLVTEIVDAANPSRLLAASDSLPDGRNEWQPMTVDFTTPSQTSAITLRLNRAPCVTGVCPIFGKVWYDNFDLQRLGSDSSGARPSSVRGRDNAADPSNR
ncbi:MAG: hypothetical protein H0T92_22705 [Pyrinomonadaceae bacterium]|nr:hypothetical protein [Pyrinomonadaceae bacterium]